MSKVNNKPLPATFTKEGDFKGYVTFKILNKDVVAKKGEGDKDANELSFGLKKALLIERHWPEIQAFIAKHRPKTPTVAEQLAVIKASGISLEDLLAEAAKAGL